MKKKVLVILPDMFLDFFREQEFHQYEMHYQNNIENINLDNFDAIIVKRSIDRVKVGYMIAEKEPFKTLIVSNYINSKELAHYNSFNFLELREKVLMDLIQNTSFYIDALIKLDTINKNVDKEEWIKDWKLDQTNKVW